jgi:hypothetical protein
MTNATRRSACAIEANKAATKTISENSSFRIISVTLAAFWRRVNGRDGKASVFCRLSRRTGSPLTRPRFAATSHHHASVVMVINVPPAHDPLRRRWRRMPGLVHDHIDLARINRRIVRHMGVVGKQQAQLVGAERQSDLRLGLPGAKMQMIEIVGNRLVEGR